MNLNSLAPTQQDILQNQESKFYKKNEKKKSNPEI